MECFWRPYLITLPLELEQTQSHMFIMTRLVV